jgi:hypothetical protein
VEHLKLALKYQRMMTNRVAGNLFKLAIIGADNNDHNHSPVNIIQGQAAR